MSRVFRTPLTVWSTRPPTVLRMCAQDSTGSSDVMERGFAKEITSGAIADVIGAWVGRCAYDAERLEFVGVGTAYAQKNPGAKGTPPTPKRPVPIATGTPGCRSAPDSFQPV